MVPDASHPAAAEALAGLGAKIAALMAAYVTAMEKMKIREGIRIAFDVSRAGNLFITVREGSSRVVRQHWLALHSAIRNICSSVILMVQFIVRFTGE